MRPVWHRLRRSATVVGRRTSAYFIPIPPPRKKGARLALEAETTLKAEIDEAAWGSLYTTKSRPFAPPETGKIAVKVINHYGDEVLKVYEV